MVMKNIGRNEVQEKWNSLAVYDVKDILERSGKRWNHCYLLRLGLEEGGVYNPVVLVGVERGSTSQVDANDLGNSIRHSLSNRGVPSNVPVLIYEAEVWDAASCRPRLLDPVEGVDGTVNLRQPFIYTLGQCISPCKSPGTEGTLGFYMARHNDKRLYGVTCRHVLGPGLKGQNKLYKYGDNGMPREYVVLPGDTTLQWSEDKIKKEVKDHQDIKGIMGAKLKNPKFNDQREIWERQRHRAQERIVECQDLLAELRKWKTPESRRVGHIVYSPPIEIVEGAPGFEVTVDACVLELDKDKFGHPPKNAVHLGTEYDRDQLMKILNPRDECAFRFEFPEDLLMELRGVVEPNELKAPKMLDENGEECLLVLKKGRTTGLTLGRINETTTLRNTRLPDGTGLANMEFGVLSLDKKGPFSDDGDSGAVIFDKTGRMVGLLAAGRGLTDSTDFTFFTPIYCLLKLLKPMGFHLNLEEEFK